MLPKLFRSRGVASLNRLGNFPVAGLINQTSSFCAATQTQAAVKKEEIPSLREFLTLEEKKLQRRALDKYKIPDFDDFLAEKNLTNDFLRTTTSVLQVNIGLYCNQTCNHCHVESSPKRKEMMDRETADRLLYLLKESPTVDTVDITGGAPELNSEFRYFVENIRKIDRDIEIIDRCNLTVLYEPGQEDLKEFLAKHKCKLICSLPCYDKKNVNRQRGKGVYDKSIQAILDLNSVGYGIPDSGLEIDLVYNPIGAFLPPPRDELEKDYKRELFNLFGIQFNYLHCFNNQPIKRFADFLYRRGELSDYMNLLVNNFNLESIDGLMCRNTVNVSWSGHIFDCDFNQMLEMPTYYKPNGNINNKIHENYELKELCDHNGPTVWDFNNLNDFKGHKISTGPHCYGCTAGAGSKCGT